MNKYITSLCIHFVICFTLLHTVHAQLSVGSSSSGGGIVDFFLFLYILASNPGLIILIVILLILVLFCSKVFESCHDNTEKTWLNDTQPVDFIYKNMEGIYIQNGTHTNMKGTVKNLTDGAIQITGQDSNCGMLKFECTGKIGYNENTQEYFLQLTKNYTSINNSTIIYLMKAPASQKNDDSIDSTFKGNWYMNQGRESGIVSMNFS
jgi:acylphosphatase